MIILEKYTWAPPSYTSLNKFIFSSLPLCVWCSCMFCFHLGGLNSLEPSSQLIRYGRLTNASLIFELRPHENWNNRSYRFYMVISFVIEMRKETRFRFGPFELTVRTQSLTIYDFIAIWAGFVACVPGEQYFPPDKLGWDAETCALGVPGICLVKKLFSWHKLFPFLGFLLYLSVGMGMVRLWIEPAKP